ncbi:MULTISPECIES: hypothetical protein [Bacteria]|jgi:hypothetical protein|nr:MULTISPECIES: hypothetical protein [Bacteria]MBB3877568.1 hypothetical protein [Sphingomonas aquatilis]MBB4049289.1 hypothetical protein [Sphingomonas zeae]MBB4610577.1 hypothetical protein [Sphingomonas yabuuchiae]MBN3557481.1 hypothetical protein [Sphingomonas yabuuchiae]NUU48078.1 hypothetical protein [Sphingomonas zeae]
MKLRQNVGNVQSHLPMVHWPRARSGANQSLQFWINIAWTHFGVLASSHSSDGQS